MKVDRLLIRLFFFWIASSVYYLQKLILIDIFSKNILYFPQENMAKHQDCMIVHKQINNQYNYLQR
jgi:hypothetical protein